MDKYTQHVNGLFISPERDLCFVCTGFLVSHRYIEHPRQSSAISAIDRIEGCLELRGVRFFHSWWLIYHQCEMAGIMRKQTCVSVLDCLLIEHDNLWMWYYVHTCPKEWVIPFNVFKEGHYNYDISFWPSPASCKVSKLSKLTLFHFIQYIRFFASNEQISYYVTAMCLFWLNQSPESPNRAPLFQKLAKSSDDSIYVSNPISTLRPRAGSIFVLHRLAPNGVLPSFSVVCPVSAEEVDTAQDPRLRCPCLLCSDCKTHLSMTADHLLRK